MFGNKKDNAPLAGVAASIDTLIGNGCTITGDLATQKSMKIDGVINGNVSAEGSIVVAERGSIKGDVTCKELVIYGVVEGNIHAESLHLHTTSRIVGVINTQKLQVESGAVYQGEVNMSTPAPTANKTKSATSTADKKINLD